MMNDHEFEQKCRNMARWDTILRVLTYLSMAGLVVMLALVQVIRYPGSIVWIELGTAAFCILCCVLLWQNLRCPHCGKLLVNYHAAVYSRPKHCIACGTVIRWKKRNAYDLQSTVRETVERPGMTDELTAQCREIARRDRVFRPLSWLALVLTIAVIFVYELRLLPSDVTLPMLVAALIFLLVTSILWSRNLRCPACGRGMTGKYTKNRISIFYLPRVHVCGHCDTRLPFQV